MSEPQDPGAAVEARFLTLGAWEAGGTRFEIASRKRLDTRQVVPYFQRAGETWAGVLRRTRASRGLRGDAVLGLEPIGIDFAGVDETGDILEYGKAIFTEHTGVRIDERALKIPLPSIARSIGYLTELSLPLLVGIEPPTGDEHAVSWDGEEHTVWYRPLRELLAEMDTGALPRSEDLALLLHALSPIAPRALHAGGDADARALLAREEARLWSEVTLSQSLRQPTGPEAFRRLGTILPQDVRFLQFHRVTSGTKFWEIVTPGSGTSLAALPYVVAGGHAYFLLWTETRVAALERRVLQPIYDSPIPARYLNATASFLPGETAKTLSAHAGEQELRTVAEIMLGQTLGRAVRVRQLTRLGRAAEPAPSVSSELRHRVAVELDPRDLSSLPDDVCIVRDDVLAHAVARGDIRDPVIALGLTMLGLPGADPFARARSGDVARRLSFLGTMTAGSSVQRRLRSYSSIESEQLGSPTYARLMTLLQHEFGVRVAYPKTESDRSFFKAAFRVFMASDRDENRALQGLHWSHDAFHFALGNFTLPPMVDFATWYDTGDKTPEIAESDPTFGSYVRALKAAEDEATFFSFWTLFAEQPSLARHVGKLTYWEAACRLGITTRAEARAIFGEVTTMARLPERVSEAAVYQADSEVRGLFEYMLGFREYHLKDIRAAFRFASREPYRGYFLRYGIYSSDEGDYVRSVQSFPARLEELSPGLNPLLAAAADIRVSHSLRVWDVVKAMKLLRAAKKQRGARDLAESFFLRLDTHAAELADIRAAISSAEIVPANEDTFARITMLGETLETLRGELWDTVERTRGLDAAVIAAERVRELPR